MNRPTDSVRIALFDSEDPNYFLVLTEVDDPANWKLPGGKFDTVDETPAVAADRELHEELGLDLEQAQVKPAGDLTNDDGISARYIFAGTVDKNQVRPTPEIAVVRWVTELTIPQSPNAAHMRSAVAAARIVLGH